MGAAAKEALIEAVFEPFWVAACFAFLVASDEVPERLTWQRGVYGFCIVAQMTSTEATLNNRLLQEFVTSGISVACGTTVTNPIGVSLCMSSDPRCREGCDHRSPAPCRFSEDTNSATPGTWQCRCRPGESRAIAAPGPSLFKPAVNVRDLSGQDDGHTPASRSTPHLSRYILIYIKP